MSEIEDLRRQIDARIRDSFRVPPHLLRPDPRVTDYTVIAVCRAYEQAFTATLLARLSEQYNAQSGEG